MTSLCLWSCPPTLGTFSKHHNHIPCHVAAGANPEPTARLENCSWLPLRARIESAPRSRIVRAIRFWRPRESIDTTPPSSISISNHSGLAATSSKLPSTQCWHDSARRYLQTAPGTALGYQPRRPTVHMRWLLLHNQIGHRDHSWKPSDSRSGTRQTDHRASGPFTKSSQIRVGIHTAQATSCQQAFALME